MIKINMLDILYNLYDTKYPNLSIRYIPNKRGEPIVEFVYDIFTFKADTKDIKLCKKFIADTQIPELLNILK